MSWPLPIIFTSWGFRHYGDRWNTAQALADWCNSCHIKTVAVQLGNDQHGCVNAELADVHALRGNGLKVIVWGIAEPDYVRRELDRLETSDADWFPQIENDPERDKVFRQIDAGIATPGIVTTYGGASNPDDVKRLQAAGVHQVHVECYSEAGYPHTDLNRMLAQGEVYGWADEELYVCLGTYRGEMPDAYTGLEETAHGYSLYLAEPMNGDQWVAFGDLALQPPPQPQPEPPEPEDDMDKVSDQQALQGANIHAQGAIQNYPDPKPRGRNTVIYRISHPGNTDDKWNKARDQVVAALDAAGVPDAD